MLSTSISEEELERIISIRTEQTKSLMDTIHDYVEHYNSNSGSNKQLNHIKTSRLIFNLINFHLGIDAKGYASNKGNRGKGNVVLQDELKTLEVELKGLLKGGKLGKIPLLDLMMECFKMNSGDIKNALETKGVGFLANELFANS